MGVPPTASKLPLCLIGLVALLLTTSLHAEGDPAFDKLLGPTFKESCVRCHGKDGKVKGDVNLLEIESIADLKEDPDLIRDLIDMIEFQDMPPDTEIPLKPDVRKQVVAELEALLRETLSESKSYASTPIRRMTRFQYNNAVQDLLQLNCVVFTLPERMMREYDAYFQPASGKMPEMVRVGSRPLGKSQLIENRLAGVAAFPQDLRAEHGYDVQGDHLSLSPLLMEAFLTLSQSILHSPDFGPKTCGIWNEFFTAPADHDSQAYVIRDRLEQFLTRAFRRPPPSEQVDRYTNHVLARLDAGDSCADSMKAAASAAIASPRFLYLYEDASTVEDMDALDDFELASRLSFFLWGSIPDDALLDRASQGTLHQPEILAQEIDRMLEDRRLKRFCDSFPAQWLQLDRIVSSVPDREHFPEFYFAKYRMSMHMMLEPLLLFETVLVENRPITDLLDPGFTYRSSQLRAAYHPGNAAKQEVTALNFQRMPLEDRREGGVITNAAVMTMTSGPERTQPITRGAWIASVIFNNPPPPPPADVPPLPEDPPKNEEHLTLRERLLMHRERADCAGCHEKIDPLGFALENYGPTGQWRDQYENGREVDMAGELFNQHPFTDIMEFKDAVLGEKDRFTEALAGHLLSFALARELDAADSLVIEHIAAATAEDDYRLRTMIKQVALSEPFLHKTNPAEAP